MDMVKNADWLIDLGPGAGAQGGWVVATGTPEKVMKTKASLTGHYLKRVLAKKVDGVREASKARSRAATVNAKQA